MDITLTQAGKSACILCRVSRIPGRMVFFRYAVARLRRLPHVLIAATACSCLFINGTATARNPKGQRCERGYHRRGNAAAFPATALSILPARIAQKRGRHSTTCNVVHRCRRLTAPLAPSPTFVDRESKGTGQTYPGNILRTDV